MSSCLPDCPGSPNVVIGSEHTDACNAEFTRRLNEIEEECASSSGFGKTFDALRLFT